MSGVANHIPHLRDYFAGHQWFSEKPAFEWNIIRRRFQLPRHQDDLDGRPASIDRMGKLKPIHAAGHLDIGEQQGNVG
jgi:hypothetical protein